MKKTLFSIFATLSLAYTTQAQDYHLSQYDANPHYLNPALIGERLFENKGIQFSANYRDQIGNYSKGAGSFKTYAVGLDLPVSPKFALGQYVLNNKSVDGAFNTLNIMLTGAYNVIHKKEDTQDKHNLSIGVQLGLLNQNIYPENFTFDSQYSTLVADGFDRNLPTGENFAQTNFYRFNANTGLYYRYRATNEKLIAYGGASLYNITRPNQSVFDAMSKLPFRWNFHAGAFYKASERITLNPTLLYITQAAAQEFNYGILLHYQLNKTGQFTSAPIVGLSVRNKNAFILHAGLKANGNIFRVSYCFVNSSDLKTYRNKGLEFSLVYTFKSHNPSQLTMPEKTVQEPVVK